MYILSSLNVNVFKNVNIPEAKELFALLGFKQNLPHSSEQVVNLFANKSQLEILEAGYNDAAAEFMNGSMVTGIEVSGPSDDLERSESSDEVSERK